MKRKVALAQGLMLSAKDVVPTLDTGCCGHVLRTSGCPGSWNGLKIFGIESCTDRTMRMASAHLAVVQDARARSGQSIGTSAGRIN